MEQLDPESRYRLLVEWIPAITYTELPRERGGDTLYISPQVEQLLGYAPAQWIGEPELWHQRLHPEDRDRVIEECELSNATGEPFRTEYRTYAADGRVVWLRDESVLVRDPDGRPLYWQGVMMDITERRLAEAALEAALDRERDAGARLMVLDRIKDTFLEAVSHDLRTPLTVVLGTAVTLSEGRVALGGPEASDLLDRLVTNARKLERLITDLLDVDRLRQGGLEANLEPTDAALLVGGIVQRFDPGVGHTVRFDGRPVTIPLDPVKVERIVENLLSNAIRHTPAGTTIDVTVQPRTDGVVIGVDDDGPGIPKGIRDHLFEPFQDREEGNGPSPGMRIGLSLVARFAGLHGGRAWVEEGGEGGASFRVFLPATDAAQRVSFLKATGVTAPERDVANTATASDLVAPPFRAWAEDRPTPATPA
jgi:PAS domain S-box-containing protein